MKNKQEKKLLVWQEFERVVLSSFEKYEEVKDHALKECLAKIKQIDEDGSE